MDVVEEVPHAGLEPQVQLHVDVVLPRVGWFLHLQGWSDREAHFQTIRKRPRAITSM